MGGHSKRSCSMKDLIRPPTLADYHVTGILNPDATGNYYLIGHYVEFPIYKQRDKAWYIWFHPGNMIWIISETYPDPGLNYWHKGFPDIVGDYTPEGTFTGIATVSKGPS